MIISRMQILQDILFYFYIKCAFLLMDKGGLGTMEPTNSRNQETPIHHERTNAIILNEKSLIFLRDGPHLFHIN